LIGANGTTTYTYPDGHVVVVTLGPDPRWKMLAPVAASVTYTSPAGLVASASEQRVANVAGGDPLALQALTDTLTINGRTFTTLYNAATSTLTDTTPLGRTTTTLLDAHGKPTFQQTLGLAPETYSYDSRGRFVGGRYGTGGSARSDAISYNLQGYLDTYTDTLGSTVTLGYDAAGRILTQTLPMGRVVSLTYDHNGNTTAIAPPGRPAHTFNYTSANLESDYTPPSAGPGTGPTHYTYNPDEQPVQAAQPGNVNVNIGYDSAHRPGSLAHPQGAEGFLYDLVTGNLSAVTSTDGVTLTYGYDGALLTDTAWSGAISGMVHDTYDSNLLLSAESVNGGAPVSFTYDQDGLLSQAGALVLSRSPQNGLLLGTTLGRVTDTFGYNSFGEVLTYSAAYSGSNLMLVQSSRDAGGRVDHKSETISGTTHAYTYTYDLAGRLTDVARDGAAPSHYGYDTNGNRTAYTGPGGTITATYDMQDRLLQYGNNSYTYTPNGELLIKTDAATSQTTTYTYDGLSNLRHVVLPGSTQIDYIIDGNNRRVGKRVNGVLVQGFLYDGEIKVMAELDGAGNVVSRFVYGSRDNVPDYMVRNGVTYRIISDQLGSPRLVVDSANGQVVQRMDYDEFGNVTLDTNEGLQPFGFAGGIYDRDTKLTRFGARDYDAETGKWTSKDPIRFAGGDPNIYEYAGNDPVNYVDPSGLCKLIQGPIRIVKRMTLRIGPIRVVNRPTLTMGPIRVVNRPTAPPITGATTGWASIPSEGPTTAPSPPTLTMGPITVVNPPPTTVAPHGHASPTLY